MKISSTLIYNGDCLAKTRITWYVLAVMLGASLAFSASAQTPNSLGLDQVIRDVVQHNDRIAAARYMEQAAQAKVGPAGAWDDPMLMLGVQNLPTNFDFTMDDMTMKMVGLSQNIPYSGYKHLARKSASSESRASSDERRADELTLVTSAKQAFFDLYYRQLNLKALESQREIQQQIVASTTAKLRVNQAGQEEVLGSQAELWRLESTILSAQQELTASANSLYVLRGLDTPKDIPALSAPPAVTVPESSAAWSDAARQVYPPLKRLKNQSEAYAFSAQSSRRMRWPMLGLSASYGIRTGEFTMPSMGRIMRDNMVSFGLQFSLPIFSGRQQGRMAKSMTAMQMSADAESAQLWREVQSDLATLHQRALRIQQSLALYRDRIVPASEEAFRSALSAYTNNNSTLVSLLAYSSAVYRDRITANELANDLATTMAQVEQYTTDPSVWEPITSDSGK